MSLQSRSQPGGSRVRFFLGFELQGPETLEESAEPYNPTLELAAQGD